MERNAVKSPGILRVACGARAGHEFLVMVAPWHMMAAGTRGSPWLVVTLDSGGARLGACLCRAALPVALSHSWSDCCCEDICSPTATLVLAVGC